MRINEYVDQVCNQIRWKKARPRVAEELTAHITDSRDALIAQGIDENAATAAAIAHTGDAALLGADFDRVHRPRPQWGMLAAMAGFVLLGLLSSVFVHGVDIDGLRIFSIVLGVALMIVAYFVDFTIFGKLRRLLYTCGILILFSLPSFTLLFPLAFAGFVFVRRDKGLKGIIDCTVIYVLLCIVALAPSFRFTTYFFYVQITGCAIFIAAHVKGWFGAGKITGAIPIGISSAALAIFGVIQTGTGRMSAAINPALDPLGFGFMGTQVRQMLRGAVLLGQGTATGQFLPPRALHSDLLLTTVIYRFGWIPFAIIICAIAAFIFAGFSRCFKQKSHLGFFVSFAIMVTFTVQTVMYVAYNLGFLFTVISLPFISPGNGMMIMNLLLAGFMLSVFRTGGAARDGDFSGVKVEG